MPYCAVVLLPGARAFARTYNLRSPGRRLGYWAITAYVTVGLPGHVVFLATVDLTTLYRRYVAALVHFHLAAGHVAQLGPTDYQAGSLLDSEGPLTTGELGRLLRLTPSATTRVVDRLITVGIDEYRGETVKAFLTLRPGAYVDGEELRSFCRARLAVYKCPTQWEFRDELPKSSTGKLQKRLLTTP